MFRLRWLTAVVCLVLTGCMVGPKYKRPPVTVPDTYRGIAPDEGPQTATSIGDEKWWQVFQDPQLQGLIREALSQNYDVRIAATRVLQAQALLGITRADQFPTITGGASSSNERLPATRITPAFETSPSQVNLSLFWELDFWGKYRRATEAARANLLATEWGQKAVMSSLVSNVASAYFQLLELDSEMDISRNTLASRKESLRLVEVRAKGGATSMLDVRQSEQLVYTAAGTIPDLERRIEQQENLISILLGKNPAPVTRGKPLVENVILPTVPAGLPSSLLERRPDIQSSEQQLVAANARIGVAKAAYFPQITLTAVGGYQSAALTNLFTGPAGLWSCWRTTGPAHFHRRKNPLQCETDGSPEAGSSPRLSAVYSAVLPRSLRFLGGLSQESGISGAAGVGHEFGARRDSVVRYAVSGWRDKLPGGS